MAVALPDRTWHGITSYLSHPVCLLLPPSNRQIELFPLFSAQSKWECGPLPIRSEWIYVLMHSVKKGKEKKKLLQRFAFSLTAWKLPINSAFAPKHFSHLYFQNYAIKTGFKNRDYLSSPKQTNIPTNKKSTVFTLILWGD